MRGGVENPRCRCDHTRWGHNMPGGGCSVCDCKKFAELVRVDPDDPATIEAAAKAIYEGWWEDGEPDECARWENLEPDDMDREGAIKSATRALAAVTQEAKP